jgi:TRAP-type C4-dicarboxylate transport system permease large subunit
MHWRPEIATGVTVVKVVLNILTSIVSGSSAATAFGHGGAQF